MNDSKVRIFVSSPADVEHERAIVKDILERLAQEFLPYFAIQPILWEEEALTADRSFQAGLVHPSDCHIVLVVLWTRLGSPLPQEPYGGMTGTEWEFFNAVEASSGRGGPEVLVYRKTNPKLVDITDSRAAQEAMGDRARLEEFFRGNFFNEDKTFRRAFRDFDSDADFRNLMEVQLRKLLNRRVFVEKRGAERTLDWRDSPFRPDKPYGFADERIFTGRETETRDLLHRLQERMQAGRGFVLVSGPSGCGKTSLIRAGVLPRLVRPFQTEGIALCRWCLLEPRADAGDPLASLADALCTGEVLGDSLRSFGIEPDLLRRSLASAPDLAVSQIRAALKELARAFEGDSGAAEIQARLMVVVDPLDGLLDSGPDAAAGAAEFFAALTALAESGQVWVLALVRSDYLNRLSRLGALADLVDEQAWVHLEVPASARIRQVVEIPALVAGLQYDVQGARNLVDTVEAEASQLGNWPPLLQGTLEGLYRARQMVADASPGEQRAGYLPLAALDEGGGLAGDALRRAERLWDALDAETRNALPILCRALVTLEHGSHPLPVVRTGDLDALEAVPACRRLVRALIDARLLVASGDRDPVLLTKCHQPDYSVKAALVRMLRQGGEEWRARIGRRGAVSQILSEDISADTGSAPASVCDWTDYRRTVVVAHPALLENWAPCRDWLADARNREVLRLRYQISRQAQLWKRTDCNREYLLGEAGFAAAKRFGEGYASELEPIETELLAQSENDLRFQRTRNRLVRTTGLVLAALLLLATTAAFWASDASRTATLNLHRSRLNAANLDIAEGNTPSAVVLALDAGRYLPGQALDTLSRAFTANRLIAMAQAPGSAPDRPVSPAFRSDGERLVTAVPGEGVTLWRLDAGRFVSDGQLAGPALGIHRVRFAGDGEDAPILGIGTTGVWRLPAASGKAPDFTCGAPGQALTAVGGRGRYLALAYPDGQEQVRVCVIDLAASAEAVSEFTVQQDEIRSLVFSPDGKYLLTASRDGRARLLDTHTGDLLLSLPPEGPLRRPVNRAVFDATGERIAVASADETVRVYSRDGSPVAELSRARNGERLFKVHNTAVRDAAFTPDGRYLVAVDDEGQVVRWDLAVAETATVLGHHDLSVEHVRLSPGVNAEDGAPLVLTASLDKTARLWDLMTGKELAVFSHDAAVTDARFSADGQRILTYSNLDGSARLWSVEPVSQIALKLPHDNHVWFLDIVRAPRELDPDGELLVATADFDGLVRVWSYGRSTGEAAPADPLVLRGHGSKVRRVSFSPSARWLASASYDGTARVWNLATGEAVCVLQVGTGDQPASVGQALFSPDEAWLLTASNDQSEPLRLWDLNTCESRALDGGLPPRGAGVQAAAVESGENDDVLIAAGADDGFVRVLRSRAGRTPELLCERRLHKAAVLELSFSPDRRLLAAASEDGRASIIELEDGECGDPLYLQGHGGNLYSVRFSPDGARLVTASLDGTAWVWGTDGSLYANLAGHNDRIYQSEFSPDGRWILTASRDGTVRIWPNPRDSKGTEETSYLILDGQLGGVAYAAFSPDGHYIAAAYWENAAVLWSLWTEDESTPEALRKAWGEDGSQLSLVREADRFRRDNGLDDRVLAR